MPVDFTYALRGMDVYGLTDVLLPFMLIFTIVFAVLQKTKILGDGKKNLNTILSLTLALMVVIPHVTNSYPAGTDIVKIMNDALPRVSLLVVAIIMLIIMVGIFYPEGYSFGAWSSLAAVVGIIGLIWIFGGSLGWFQNWSWFVNTFGEETITVAIVIIVFALVIWFVTGEKKTGGTRFMEGLDKFFRGPGTGGH